MKNLLYILLFSFLSFLFACDLERIETGVGNVTKFNTSFGGGENDFPLDVFANADGTYFVAGSSQEITGQNSDAYLAKVNANGVLIWENHYGTSDYDGARSLVPVSDGGVIICGTSPDPGNSYPNIFIVKVNTSGSEVWRKTYGVADSAEFVAGIIPTGVSDYIVGYTSEFIFGSDNSKSIKFLRINANGAKVSNKLGASVDVSLNEMIKTADNSIVVAGSMYITGTGTYSYIAKFTEAGNFIWDQVFPETGTGFTPAYGVVELADKSLVLAGSDLGGNDHDFLLVGYSEIGMKLNDVSWGGANADEALAITLAQDGDIVVAGYSQSISATSEVYISKRNKTTGAEIWVRHFDFGGGGATDIELCPDGGFVFCAAQLNNSDIILVKTDANGNYQ